MSVAVANQGAVVAPVEKKSLAFWQICALVALIFFGTSCLIDRMHPRTPIKTAIAGLIRMVPFLAPFLLLDEPHDPGPAMSMGPEECDCECLPDGSARAVVDGKVVPALNHEFGS